MSDTWTVKIYVGRQTQESGYKESYKYTCTGAPAVPPVGERVCVDDGLADLRVRGVSVTYYDRVVTIEVA